MIWKPNTTVAAVVEQNGHFLLIEETTERGNRYNQPAGHLEDGETLFQAVIRETQEESAYGFTPTHLLGVYHWKLTQKDITYLRFAFIGDAHSHQAAQRLDDGIIRAVWMTVDEIRELEKQYLTRSPQVLNCVEDYLNGKRFPLEVVSHL